MATYTKETALFDTGAISGDIQDASETASNYLTDVTGGGVYVHSADTPSDPSASTAKGVKITDQVDIIRGGTSVASFSTNVVLGDATKAHTDIDNGGMQIYSIDSNLNLVQLANIGYGRGQAISSIEVAPYYTLGTRQLTTERYDPTLTYMVGDMCVHNDGGWDKIYICYLDNTTGEWDASKWFYYIGNYSMAEGYRTKACGYGSHTEGRSTTALGDSAHAEGRLTIARGIAHAEGNETKAFITGSHAEGDRTRALGYASHAQNWFTIANERAQTVIGRFNDNQTDTAFEIGNGELNARSNALTVDWSGRVECGDYSGNFKSIFDIFYPVGSYYETSDTTFDPNTAWGGTWVKDSAGKVTVAQDTSDTSFDTIGETGGSKYIQAHTHSFTQPTITSYYRSTVNYSSGSAARPYTSSGSSSSTDWAKARGGAVGAVSGATTGSAGNLQPYIVVNRWHRTA